MLPDFVFGRPLGDGDRLHETASAGLPLVGRLKLRLALGTSEPPWRSCQTRWRENDLRNRDLSGRPSVFDAVALRLGRLSHTACAFFEPSADCDGWCDSLAEARLFWQVDKISMKITRHQARCVHLLFDHISPHFSLHLHDLFRSNPVSSFFGGYSSFSGVCSVHLCTVIPGTL